VTAPQTSRSLSIPRGLAAPKEFQLVWTLVRFEYLKAGALSKYFDGLQNLAETAGKPRLEAWLTLFGLLMLFEGCEWSFLKKFPTGRQKNSYSQVAGEQVVLTRCSR
jgi:hypothetical protein